ncbi:MAG TPA: hypothetical protein VGJ20_25060 [Xanthobacteraceae bacterium]|jgi:hypothetical protein
MSPAYSSDVSWCGRLARALHMLMVIVVAALVGGVVGGFGVFALVTVVTTQHRSEMAAADARQRRHADTTMPAVAPAQQAPVAPNAGASDDRLATAPSSATPTESSIEAQTSPAAPTAETSAAPPTQPLAQTPATMGTRNAKYAKKHFTVMSRAAPVATNDESISTPEPNRKVFDYDESQRPGAREDIAGLPEDAAPARSDAQRPWLRSGAKRRAARPRLARRQQRPQDMYGSQAFVARRTIRPYYYADERYGWGSQNRWGGGFFGGGNWRY